MSPISTVSKKKVPPHPQTVLNPAIGVFTLYYKEVHRFLKVWTQTLFAPLITVALFMVIFSVSTGLGKTVVGTVPFPIFLAPGLIMMSVIQNAFANSSSTLILSKIQGSIFDMLLPPLKPHEIVLGLILGAVTRGLLIGIILWVFMWAFVGLTPSNLWYIASFLILSSFLVGSVGVLVGIWAEKFDQIAAFTNFVITPLSFLSGTFYNIQRLSEPWSIIAYFNPFFYMIDGFRYGFTQESDADPILGLCILLVINIFLFLLCTYLMKIGYKTKQ